MVSDFWAALATLDFTVNITCLSQAFNFDGRLSLNVDLLRGLLPFWCLSVDKSRDTTKNYPLLS